MKNLLLILGLFLSLGIVADHHKNKEEKSKDGPKNPNHLMTFKQCKETKEGVGGILSLADKTWKEIEEYPEDESKWEEAAVLANMAANYSTIYEVWCKDMVNQRIKMRKIAEKKNHMKDHKHKERDKKDN
ncbi:MAG: hypothetical protein CMD46_04385 [Gammaproteobacteria bacterium]|nr:hypothetical protein [Gammaproteobacteria bacterium]|tara:strand:+ start:249 stop:638 length:390 start_codon:yes stop_codon:yes gene_type:complete